MKKPLEKAMKEKPCDFVILFNALNRIGCGGVAIIDKTGKGKYTAVTVGRDGKLQTRRSRVLKTAHAALTDLLIQIQKTDR